MLPQANAYAMIRRRAAGAGIETKLGNHTFRATEITAYLKNDGTLEKAAAMRSSGIYYQNTPILSGRRSILPGRVAGKADRIMRRSLPATGPA